MKGEHGVPRECVLLARSGSVLSIRALDQLVRLNMLAHRGISMVRLLEGSGQSICACTLWDCEDRMRAKTGNALMAYEQWIV